MYKILLLMSGWEDLNKPFMDNFQLAMKDHPDVEVEQLPEGKIDGAKAYFFVRSTPAFVVTKEGQMVAKESGVISVGHMKEILKVLDK